MLKKLKKPLSIRLRIIIGVTLLGLSAFVYQYNKTFRADAVKTQGIVVEVIVTTDSDDGDLNYYPVFEYTAKNGKVYQYKSMISSANKFIIGDTDTIYYSKDNPENARYGESNFNVFSLLSLVIGVIVLLKIFISFGVRFFINAKNDKLKKDGLKINIPSSHIYVIDYNKDDKLMYVVVGQWYNDQTNKVYMFKSSPLSYDPEKELKEESIRVYMNKRKHKEYYVDLSFLNSKN